MRSRAEVIRFPAHGSESFNGLFVLPNEGGVGLSPGIVGLNGDLVFPNIVMVDPNGGTVGVNEATVGANEAGVGLNDEKIDLNLAAVPENIGDISLSYRRKSISIRRILPSSNESRIQSFPNQDGAKSIGTSDQFSREARLKSQIIKNLEN